MNQPSQKEKNMPLIHSVFYEIMVMARRENCKQLKHWAFIHSVANYARGVGQAAESAFAYFGHTMSYTTQHRVMARLMGSDKQGIRKNDTMNHNQSRLLRVQQALIVAYDNYQRGFKLLHQRGQHSSAFLKGTHQCAHQVILPEVLASNQHL